MTYEEHTTLLHLLKSYCRYLLTDAGKQSLIMRISGCYSLTMYGIRKYFFVMDNLFDPKACPKPTEIFDLKGSWVDRHVGPPRSEFEKKKAKTQTRKDTDWPASRFLRLSDDARRRILRQAQRDARFLADNRIMDYSMLGIHIVQEERPVAIRDRIDRAPHSWSAQSFEGPGSYQMGIIDTLQRWTLSKRAERYFKILANCRCAADLREGMSAIDPVTYARRFHERFGTEQLKLSLAQVRMDWDEESATREAAAAAAVAAARQHYYQAYMCT